MGVSKGTALLFLKGNKKAVEKVYLEYKNLMFFIIASYVPNKDDCEDILSDSFLKAMEHREQLKDPSKIKSFLSSIARHEALDFLKKKREIPSSEIIDELYDEEECSNGLLSLLEPHLSNKETIVVYLKVGFSYTWAEIAEETGIS
ncbi:MAG: sigma-70 family RNA polymerase sigma factor, partial [Bacilli bacterium]|nr:sigma-70 family RNA polymerase sigma factor [Bacilli bacterium]